VPSGGLLSVVLDQGKSKNPVVQGGLTALLAAAIMASTFKDWQY
jgi:hypothetical protein